MAAQYAGTISSLIERLEEQRCIFQNIRQMQRKAKRSFTVQVKITDHDNFVQEYVSQKSMEEMVARNNEAKYYQT